MKKIDLFGKKRLLLIRGILSMLVNGNKNYVSDRKKLVELICELHEYEDKWFAEIIVKYIKELSKDFLSGRGV